MPNLTQVVKAERKMTTLTNGLVASGPDSVLSGTRPFTGFALLDTAFGKLERRVADDLPKPEYKVSLSDFKEVDKLKAIDGRESPVRVWMVMSAVEMFMKPTGNRYLLCSSLFT